MSTAAESRRVLVCGANSFVAKKLVARLQADGHTVTRFGRGALASSGDFANTIITGPVELMHENPHLTGPFDTVINYILLKDELVLPNIAYVESLLKYCVDHGVKHLIHISSVSVYAGDLRDVNESSPVETDSKKGPYAGLKVAQDRYLLEHMPAVDQLKITFVRPGFVLGPGLLDPMVGMAARLPWNRLLILGDSSNSLPVVRRDMVDEALSRIVAAPPGEQAAVYLLLSPQSPSRKQWLNVCCEAIGAGKGTVWVPRFIWRMGGLGGGIVAKMIGMKMNPGRTIRNALRVQWFNPSASEKKLGMDMKFDCREALIDSMDNQRPNFQIPYPPIHWKETAAKHVTFLGYGGIVKQKHLPALKWIGFNGQIDAYDLKAGVDEKTGQTIRAIEGATLPQSDLYVVATPGRVHNLAIPMLQQAPPATVMVEKPLCYSKEELNQWTEFAAGRKDPVLICHNYRFKKNVAAMLDHLKKYNPGKLLHVDLNYQSLPVAKHYPAWRRAEREAQTLLMEYALHYIDLACMFHRGEWNVASVRYELNLNGETSLIQGELQSDSYTVSMLLRQAILPRRAKVLFTFQNYTVNLGFFPDTFVAYMAHDNPALYTMERKASSRAMGRKIMDKLTNKDSDQSHPAAYLAAMEPGLNLSPAIKLENLRDFYDLIFRIGDAVYK